MIWYYNTNKESGARQRDASCAALYKRVAINRNVELTAGVEETLHCMSDTLGNSDFDIRAIFSKAIYTSQYGIVK